MHDVDDRKMYESIFGQDKPWDQSTAPGRLDKRGWENYAMAYKVAADRLVVGLQRGPYSEHYQVFPIMFLYRHYLELKLKDILLILRDWKGIREQKLPDHRLTPLWEEVRQLLEEFDSAMTKHCDDTRLEEGAAIYNAIEQRVKEFNEIDVKAENFRYPVDKKLNPNSAKLLERHEIVHINEVVSALDMNLDGMSVGLDEILSHWNEWHG